MRVEPILIFVLNIVCGYSYVVVGPDGKAYRSEVYRGLDANDHFLDVLEKERKTINEIFENPKSMTMTETDIIFFKESKQCWICEKPFYGNDKNRRVCDHCHFTGKYRGAAHSYCNLQLSVKPGKTIITTIFHNLRGSIRFSSHHAGHK